MHTHTPRMVGERISGCFGITNTCPYQFKLMMHFQLTPEIQICDFSTNRATLDYDVVNFGQYHVVKCLFRSYDLFSCNSYHGVAYRTRWYEIHGQRAFIILPKLPRVAQLWDVRLDVCILLGKWYLTNVYNFYSFQKIAFLPQNDLFDQVMYIKKSETWIFCFGIV